MTDELQFDAATHTYTLRGVRVVSVTQVLKAEGLTGQYFNQDAARRGTMVHHATVQMDSWLGTEGFPEEYEGYLSAYSAFMAGFYGLWTGIEQRLYSESLNVCGTADRVSENEVWDIKTGAETPADQLQLAGYASMLSGSRARFNLYLRADGTYEIKERKDPKDFIVFKNAVYNHAWKRANGVKV